MTTRRWNDARTAIARVRTFSLNVRSHAFAFSHHFRRSVKVSSVSRCSTLPRHSSFVRFGAQNLLIVTGFFFLNHLRQMSCSTCRLSLRLVTHPVSIVHDQKLGETQDIVFQAWDRIVLYVNLNLDDRKMLSFGRVSLLVLVVSGSFVWSTQAAAGRGGAITRGGGGMFLDYSDQFGRIK